MPETSAEWTSSGSASRASPAMAGVDASLLQDSTECFTGTALPIQFQEVFELYPNSIQSFSLGRCHGWRSRSLDEGSCSDEGLLLVHPQLPLQLWGSYGEA